MLTLKIYPEDVKGFMNALLRTETFDLFEVRGVDITTFTHFNISGQKIMPKPLKTESENLKKNESAVTESEEENIPIEKNQYCKWSELRPYVFDIIKGALRPSYIKVIFSLNPDEAIKLHSNAASMYLNIQFNGEEVYLTSATSQLKFALDKTVDHEWEDYIKRFFAVSKIKVNEAELV